MEDYLEKLLENMSQEDITKILVNLNKYQLNSKPHIKKYNKIRKLHGGIIDNMENLLGNGKYSIDKYYNSIIDDVQRETKGLDLYLDSDNADDRTILDELFIYKNHPKIPSLTEIYLDKKKFKNEEKLKMLNSMKNSYVGLFKIIETNREDGYVTYEDVFTHKKVKVIDISLSTTLKIDEKRTVYSYNRIITYEDISFATGIHCIMTSNNKKLKDFIKNHKYSKCSDFSRCLLIYNLSKNSKDDLVVTYNNQYGYRS